MPANMTPLDVLRSRRRSITKLVYSYVMACGQCHDDDEVIARFLNSDADTVTQAVSALIRDGLVRMSVQGHRVLMLASEARLPTATLDASLEKLLRAMDSKLAVWQIKPADRELTSSQAGIMADSAMMERICLQLAAWQDHARKNVWPFNQRPNHIFTLAEILGRLQDIAEFKPARNQQQQNKEQPNERARIYL